MISEEYFSLAEGIDYLLKPLGSAHNIKENKSSNEYILFKSLFIVYVDGKPLVEKKKIYSFKKDHITFSELKNTIKSFSPERKDIASDIRRKCETIGINYYCFGKNPSIRFIHKDNEVKVIQHFKKLHDKQEYLKTGHIALNAAVKYFFKLEQQITLSWANSPKTHTDYKEYNLFKSLFGVQFENSVLYSKGKIDIFKENHRSFEEVVNSVKSFIATRNFYSYVLKEKCGIMGIDCYSFGAKNKYIFVKKEDFEKLIQYLKMINGLKSELFQRVQMVEELGVSKEIFKEVVKKYNIKPFIVTKREEIYHEKDLLMLKETQEKLLSDLSEKYYTIEEIENLIGKEAQFIVEKIGLKKNYKPVPLLCKTKGKGEKYIHKSILLPKQIIDLYTNKLIEIDEESKRNKLINLEEIQFKEIATNNQYSLNKKTEDYINYRQNKEKYKEIMQLYINIPYKAFCELVEYHKIEFGNNSKLTARIWKKHVLQKLNNSNKNDRGMRTLISTLVKVTLLLSQVTVGKEIFRFSTKHIETTLFNNNIPIGWQQLIYSFLFGLNKISSNYGIKLSYNVELILNPKHKIKVKEKNIYPIDEYLNILEFCANFNIHKKRALEEAKKELIGEGKFINYSNMWLFVSILLNNAWRKSDVLEFPGLPETMYKEIDIDWLENHELTKLEAEMIADYYRGKVFYHGKTKQKRHFIISDELLFSFAYSILISTFIQRSLYPLSKNVMVIGSINSFSTYNHDAFFFTYKGKTNDFKFKSSIINRSLMSYMVSVVGKLTKRNPVELIKVFRSHSDIEITNIYLDIPQEQVDLIAIQLFNLGNFGFVFDTMSTTLFGEQAKDNEKRTKKANIVKKAMGSINNIEAVAGYINSIFEERNILKDIINEIPKKELLEKYTLINLGIMPSKQQDFQCFVGETNCPFDIRECENCSLAIQNLYTLTSVNSRIQRKISEFTASFEKTQLEAEKIKLANHLYSERELVKKAIRRFGREKVDLFIEGGLNELNKQFQKLPSFKNYLTISEEWFK